MKLVTFTHFGKKRFGAVLHNVAIDLTKACTAFQKAEGDLGLTEGDYPQDIRSLLQCDENTWQAGRDVLNWVEVSGKYNSTAAYVYPLSQIQIDPPIPNPSKIVCVGLNYADHCRENNFEIPTSPILFSKFPSALIGLGDPITWPEEVSEKVDYEAELAVVIAREARGVPAKEAYDYIGGYTVVNDVSARDVQFADQQWVRGKSFDTFCPAGPYLVTPDEVGDPHELSIQCWINGELRQDSNTKQLIFKIPELIEFITKTCTLMPGDLICTGTPGGVGVFRDPPVFLKPGDVVEIEIEKLGRLRNPVK